MAALFLGTHLHRVDGKGRVSVPAAFRQALAARGLAAVVLLPPQEMHALEGIGEDALAARAEAAGAGADAFSTGASEAAMRFFADAVRLEWDAGGRVLAPAELLRAAGIEGEAAFAGLGARFQIWSPGRLEAAKKAARAADGRRAPSGGRGR